MMKCNIFANLKQNNRTNQHLWMFGEILPMGSEIIDRINIKEHEGLNPTIVTITY